MAQKKTKERKQTELSEGYDLEVKSFETRMSAGINARVGPGGYHVSRDDPLYEVHLTLDIVAKCIAPEHNEGEDFKIIMHSYEREDWLSKRVADVQHSDEDGSPKYAKRGRTVVPVFDAPRSIGGLSRHRKVEPWIALVGVPFAVVNEFQTALSRELAPYMSLIVLRIGRERHIHSVSFSTVGPFDE